MTTTLSPDPRRLPGTDSFGGCALEQLLEHAELLVAIKDSALRYRRVSRRMREMLAQFGCSDPIGKTVGEILPDELAREVDDNDRQALASRAPTQHEGKLAIDGRKHSYLTTRTPLLDARGNIQGLCLIGIEITARKRTEQALRDVAMGVSAVAGEKTHEQIARFLASTLEVDLALIGVLDTSHGDRIQTLAIWHAGQLLPNVTYALAGTPCQHVVGRRFEFIPSGLRERFPDDGMVKGFGFESYAAYPLFDSQHHPLGIISVADSNAMRDRELTEAILKIFSVRAAAEVERTRVQREREISESSYRNIFEASEDCIFVHDFDTGAILDVNPKTCETYGYTLDELRAMDVGALSSGDPPYVQATAAAYMARARSGETVRFEWHRRNKDGSLHWDEVVLKPAVLGNHRRIIAASREITERKHAEAALESREEQYRAIFNASVDGMALWDTQGRNVDVNRAFARMHGYTRDEMLAMDPHTFVHPDSYPTLERFFDTFNSGEPFHAEARDVRRDGSVFDVEVNGVLMDYQGRPHLLAIVRDITERRAAEAALRASEEQYRAIFDASADAMVLYNADGHIVDLNPAFVTLYGYSRAETLAMDPRTRFHPDAVEVLERFLRRVRGGWFHQPERLGRTFREETREITKDGRVLDLEAYLAPMTYHGKPHVLAIKRDITERKEREKALRKSEDRLRATINAALDCIITMDAGGRILEFNPAAEACFGYRRAEVIGRPLADLLIPERDRDAHRQALARHRRSGSDRFVGRRLEVTAMRRDGSEFPADLAIGVAHGGDGGIFIGYLRDITRLQEAERARIELERQLRQAQKMEAIGHLTGGIAHDFNNILTSILGYTLLAHERPAAETDEKLTHYLEQVRMSGERARDLIRQMLTFSRGQRGEAQPLALATLVKEAVRLYGSTFPSSIQFQTRTDATAPCIHADPIQVEQVLMNLCINARDAMTGGGVIGIAVNDVPNVSAVCASCRQPVEGHFVEVAVSDTGTGITADVLERIFEPFFTTKEVGQGSGMGLSTAHGIVHEHKGHLLVDTTPGAGSRFRVLYPPAKDATARPTGRPDTAAEQAVTADFAGRVLVVDDEASVREFLRDLLESRGFTVTLAANGEDGRHQVENEPGAFDLIVTDQIMPQLTGLGMSEALRARGITIPVVLCTGYSDALNEAAMQRSRVNKVLRKPLDAGELFGEIEGLLSGDG
ncbi:hybrid sensor histidine kinase/response regulator [Arhodomonas sp. AD133]|uniref:hybrid sensor histidine kinase/response regulator n=1 Tax=Arhodomonas sp. AD133 TaxID=3415009 RepID=UPI003EB87231